MLVQSADVKGSKKIDVVRSKVRLIDTFKRVSKPSSILLCVTTVFKERFLKVYSFKVVNSANNTLEPSKHNSKN